MSYTPLQLVCSSGSPVDTCWALVVVIVITGYSGGRVQAVTVGWPPPRCSTAGVHAAVLHRAPASNLADPKENKSDVTIGEVANEQNNYGTRDS